MKRSTLAIVASAVVALLVGGFVALAAPSGNIWNSVAVCDPNSPTHCVAPASDGTLPTSSSGSIPAGTNDIGNVGVGQATATSGQKGPLVQCAVTTDPPVYVTTQTDPCSMTIAGDQRVVEPDDLQVSGSVTSATNIFSVDMRGYESITVHMTAFGSGAVSSESSDDNSTWTTVPGLNVQSSGGQIPSSGIFGVSMIKYPKYGRYFRVRVTSYTSGTFTVVGNLHKSPGSFFGTTFVNGGSIGVLYPTTGNGTGVPETATSGLVSNTAAVATLATAAGKTTYITGFQCTPGSATAAAVVSVVVSGLITGSNTYSVYATNATTFVPAPVPLVVTYNPPLPASATNTTIVVTMGAVGAGGATAVCNAQGFLL